MFIVASGLHFGTNNCFYSFLMDRCIMLSIAKLFF